MAVGTIFPLRRTDGPKRTEKSGKVVIYRPEYLLRVELTGYSLVMVTVSPLIPLAS